jgi:uncharacterized protein YjbI with pentapeptide repeats
LRDTSLESAVLVAANFENAHVQRINLTMANLATANLRFASLVSSIISRRSLTHKNSRVDLRSVVFGGTQTHACNLTNADLTSCNFVGTNLRFVNFEGANLSGADFTVIQ